MNEQHPYRATLPPVPEGVFRPLWSVMIPTYNCSKYLRQTLASVLAQDPGAQLMQIEVVDDCSTQDDPAAVVEELGGGRVGFYRQPQNVGHVKNFQTCLERSRGHLIHLLHGDDCVRPGFYHKLQPAFEQNPEIGAAFCRQIVMDEQGHWQYLTWLEQPESGVLSNWLERIAVEQRIQTPSIVVQREVYEKLGGFDSRLSSAEDWEMWVRIAANYPFWYETEPLAVYRIHSNSNTERHLHNGKEIQNLRQVIEIIQPYLPPTIASELSNKAGENWGIYAIQDVAQQMLAQGDFVAATIQMQEALKCSRSLKLIGGSLLLLLRIGKIWLQKTLNKFYKLP